MALVQVCGVCGTRSPHGTAACPRCTARVFGFEGGQEPDPALSAFGPGDAPAAVSDPAFDQFMLEHLRKTFPIHVEERAGAREHPGYGEPLTGTEHPADGTWSPEISGTVSRETVPPDDAPVPDTPSADGTPGIPARAPRKPRARKAASPEITANGDAG